MSDTELEQLAPVVTRVQVLRSEVSTYQLTADIGLLKEGCGVALNF